VMTFVTLQQQIRDMLFQLERQAHNTGSPVREECGSPEKSASLGCSPDVNNLGIANIAINNT